MNPLFDVFRQLGTLVLRLVALLAAMVFAFSLVLAALLLVAGVSIWSLLTGRRPAPWVLFQRLRARSRPFSQPFDRARAWSYASRPASPYQSQATAPTPSPVATPFSRVFTGSSDRFGRTRARSGRITDVVDVQATEVADTPDAGAAPASGPSSAPGASGAGRCQAPGDGTALRLKHAGGRRTGRAVNSIRRPA